MEVIIDGVRYVPVVDAPTDSKLLSALSLRFDSDAGSQLTVRDYFYKLLAALWAEGESFSGKRPFGNGGWEYDLYRPLIEAGFIDGVLDEDGYVEDFADKDAADQFVFDLICAAFYGVSD